MTPRYVDAHCHVQFDAYASDHDDVIARMREREVAGVVVGCDLETSRKAIELAERHDHLFASVGLHPNRDSDPDLADGPFDARAYRTLAEHPAVVAIGECGLDYYRPASVTDAVKAEQKELFKQQIVLAAELDKPLIIHTRPAKGTMDAYHDAIALLQEAKANHPNLRGDIHFFVGGVEEARAFIELGFTLSFTAVVTFARDYDEVIRSVPLTSILAETDAPYVAPASRRGTRNDPLAVEEVVAALSSIRGEDQELVRATLLENTSRLFDLGALG